MNTTYKEALGIATRDIVSTSYGGAWKATVIHITGPYTSSRSVGAFVIWPFSVISLALVAFGDEDLIGEHRYSYINEIHQGEDGRWFNDSGDEIFVEKNADRPPMQMDMFATGALPAPYQFQPGVDYSGPDGTVFKCPACGIDFNAIKTDRWCNPYHCGCLPALTIIVMGRGKLNSFVRMLNA